VETNLEWEMDGTCCMLQDFWVPSIRYNDVALCIISLELSNRSSYLESCMQQEHIKVELRMRQVTQYSTCMVVNIVNPRLCQARLHHPIVSPFA